MIQPDLHLHTTASDGIFAPAQVVFLAKEKGINFLAITDHDTISGVNEAKEAARQHKITLIPGVEINAGGEEEVHILGYGIKTEQELINSFLKKMADERIRRFYRMGEKLLSLGFSLDLEAIIEKAGMSLGRPHFARAMIEKGYISSVSEAFEKYIGKGCPAYVPRERQSVADVISILRASGAVPVLAHPMLLHWPTEKLLPMLDVWQKNGLMGMEVYHPGNRGEFAMLERLARERGLLVTGGSDFHDGDTRRHGAMGETIPEWKNAEQDAQKLLEMTKSI